MQPAATTAGTGFRLAFALADRNIGDVHPLEVPRDVLAARQTALAGERWAMLDEVHGTEMVDVDTALDALGGPPSSAMPTILGRGDVLLTRRAGRRLAVWVGDCAPVGVLGDGGTLVAFHAGWAGLAAGIVDIAVEAISAAGERPIEAVCGPLIGPCCYEFGEADLRRVAAGVGAPVDEIVGTTNTGTRALDVPSALRHALGRRGLHPTEVGGCTGCQPERWYSHRVRRDTGRHALVVWSEHR